MVLRGMQPSVTLSRNTPHEEAQHTLKGPSAFCVWPERSWAKEGPGLVSLGASPILLFPLPLTAHVLGSPGHAGVAGLGAAECTAGPQGGPFPEPE